MGDIKSLLLLQIDATRIVERILENFKKLGKAKLTVATDQNRITRLNDAFAECQKAERSSSGYFTQDGFLAVHKIFLEPSDYMAETFSSLKTTSSSDKTRPTAGPDSQYYDVTNRLPTLELAQFSGVFIEWETFSDKFKSMIIAHKGLSNVSRFQYLLSCLKGEASELVDNIVITDAGYTIAWDMLVANYDNKRMLVATHLETLYDLPHVWSESVDQLRKVRDKTNKTWKNLFNLERPVKHWDDILVFLITKMLDNESRMAWDLELGKRTDCPTFYALDEMLQSRICALQTIKPVTTDSASRIADSVKSKSSRSRATSLHGAAAAKSPSALYNANHTSGQYASFKNKSVSQRFEYAKGINRCINCLSPRHPTKKCTTAYNCSICKKRHHTLLYFNKSTASSTGTASSHNAASPTDNDNSLVTSQHASCSVPRIIAIQQVILATAWVEL